MPWAQTTVRFRLALLLAALVVASGTALLAAALLITRTNLGGVSVQISGSFGSGAGGQGSQSGQQS